MIERRILATLLLISCRRRQSSLFPPFKPHKTADSHTHTDRPEAGLDCASLSPSASLASVSLPDCVSRSDLLLP